MSGPTHAMGVVDAPIREDGQDALGLNRYAEALGQFILECDTPMTVGIQGDWGAGKTSLMNLIDGWLQRRTRKPAPPTFTLNTWQYAQLCKGDDLALVVLRALQERVGESGDSLARMWGQMASAFGRVRAIGLGGVEVQVADASELPDLGELKKGFATSVQHRLARCGEGRDRLVVFIDDLDRIHPERAVEILEALKNFVDVPGCVFVLACDYAVVTKGLKKKFDVGAEDLGGRSFFDKIIQVPFRMPVHHYQVDRYVRSMLERIGWSLYRNDVTIYERLIERSVGFNPRGLKRLCNTLLLLRMVGAGSDESRELVASDHRLALLFGLVCMESAHERLYARVARGSTSELRQTLERATRDSDGAEQSEPDEDALTPAEASFLRELTTLVDVDRNGYLDDAEIAQLVQMLKLSAVTSLVEEPRTGTIQIEENIVAKADTLGQTEVMRPFQQLLDGALASGLVKKRMTEGSIVYELRRKDTERWAPFVYLTPHKKHHFQVSVFVPTVVHFNDDQSAWSSVLSRMRELGAHETTAKNIVRLPVKNMTEVGEAMTLLRKLQPVALWA